MKLRCPGCLAALHADDEHDHQKTLLQCPECLYIFLAASGQPAPEAAEPGVPEGEATMLTSDFAPEGDARQFQWNVPGASLTIVEGDRQGIHRRLREEQLTIGRRGSDLPLEDKAVSRRHAEIFHRANGWWIRDLASTNGTFLNNQRVTEAELHHLDEIRLGATRILFALASAPGGRLEREDDSGLDRTQGEEGNPQPEYHLPTDRELFLEVMTPPGKGRSHRLEKGRVVIGRAEEADLRLDDQGASRKHALIEIFSRDQFYLSDLASQNGTWLNGIRVRNTRLLNGDLIRVGNTVLKLVVLDLPEK
jgi:pSer/pThr/pTyr-binding forkhead associated (FHA) protein